MDPTDELLSVPVATTEIRGPGSRLRDDLYRLYLAAFGWLVFPVYGEGFAAVLPTATWTMRWVYPIAAAGVQLGWIWSGLRGGPMMVSNASIVHELGAPVSARRVLAPQLLRQAVAWGAGGALVGGTLTSLGDDYSFATAFRVSGAGFLLCFAAVAWACTLMTGLRLTDSMRARLVGAALVAATLVVATVLGAGTITSGAVLIVLLVVAIAGGVMAWYSLDAIPIPHLWRRARNLESARSAMLEVDFHRMMVDLRGAGEDKPAGETRLPTGRWLSWWRCVTPLRHAMPWSGVRLVASLIAGTVLVAFAPLDQGVVVLAIGAVWLAVGYEVTRGLAAIADQVAFFVHYPLGSFRLLFGQLIMSFGIGALLMTLANGWRLPTDRTGAVAATLIAAMGILGGAMQARLGSPDTTSIVAKYGLQNASALLWARAAAAPIAVVVAVILVFHGYLRPAQLDLGFDVSAPAQFALALLFAGSLAVCLSPLRGFAR